MAFQNRYQNSVIIYDKHNYATLIVYYLLLIYALLLSNNVYIGAYMPKMHITVLMIRLNII